MSDFPKVKPLDLATVINLAILHGRGYACTPETRKDIHKMTEDDRAALMSFNPDGLAQYERLEELMHWAWKNREGGAA